MRRPLLGVAAACLLAACSTPDAPSPPADDGCQTLVDDCFLPYPSDFFLAADATTPSGRRVVTSGKGKLRTKEDKSADVGDWWSADGFSRMPSIVAVLGAEIPADALTGIAGDPAATLSASSRTQIIEVSTGMRVPHFADLDPRATSPSRQALVLHPLVRLAEKARYVVVLRGLGVPAPAGFAGLRDRTTTGALAERFERDVFPVIESAGVPRAELTLAWDFTTGTDAHVRGDMLRVRELTLAWLATSRPSIKIIRAQEGTDPKIWRTVQGTISGPLFTTEVGPGALLARDASGRVTQTGTVAIPFTVQIPKSVHDSGAPGRVLAFAHGFFGGRYELSESEAVTIADRLKIVLVGIDWWGMSRDDVFLVVDGLVSDPTRTLIFTDRVHQAMANWLVTTRAIKGGLAEVPEVAGSFDPSPPLNFIGLSQGHILGGVQVALNPDAERIVLGVGGAGFTHMMFRARPFVPFLNFMAYSIEDPLDQQKYVATLQNALDRIDAGTYADLVLASPLPGTPRDRRLLMHVGLGDTQVPNLATFLHARILGLGYTSPSPAPVYGLEPVTPPVMGSALTVFDFGVDLGVYRRAYPPDQGNDVHAGLRVTASALRQMDAFFRADSEIIHPCTGPCDPL